MKPSTSRVPIGTQASHDGARMSRRGCALFLLLLAPLQPAGGQSACEDWNTPAFFQQASLDALEQCLAAGADPNSRDADGWTPLHHAAQFADTLAVFAVLVAAGGDPDADEEAPSPLAIAAANNRPPGVIAALAHAGADPNAADDDGWTALHWAAKHADSPHVFATLGAQGADPNAADDSGWTPLHVASSSTRIPTKARVPS